ncbi:MAG: hypothetical protein PHV03_08520 [Desulfitobacteriaceae bacterium]|nr:hypothetical protein [Desulfitobacteriaceae bacterium]
MRYLLLVILRRAAINTPIRGPEIRLAIVPRAKGSAVKFIPNAFLSLPSRSMAEY